jgi:hypothetical protein
MARVLIDVAYGVFLGAVGGCVLLWINRCRRKREEQRERQAMRELLLHVSQKIGDEEQ